MRIFFQKPTKGPLITVLFDANDGASLAFVPAAVDCGAKYGVVASGGAAGAPVIATAAIVGALVPGDSPVRMPGINRFAPRGSAARDTTTAPPAPAVSMADDISPTAADVNKTLAALIAQMNLRSERDIDALHALYDELTEHGDTPQEAVERITQLYNVLKVLFGIQKNDVIEVLNYVPDVLTALRYSGANKEDAWEILLEHVRTAWPFLPELLAEYSKFLTPGHSFDLRYVRSAHAIRMALKFNNFLPLDSPATFADLDRFAEMGWSDDEVFALVKAMIDAISTRNMRGFYRGYPDRLYNSHFQLLPPIVEALGGRNPDRRAAITAFIAQLTQDTGEWYLEHALRAIGLLAAQGKLASENQDEILAARAWELYIRHAHDEGIQIPDPTGTERNQFENHFAYLFDTSFDLEFVKSLHKIQAALDDRYIGSLDHPEAFALWRDMQQLGWVEDTLIDFLNEMKVENLETLSDVYRGNLYLLLRAATTLGAKNPMHYKAAVQALKQLQRDNWTRIYIYSQPDALLESLQDLAGFAAMPTIPERASEYVDSIIYRIADVDFPTWTRVKRTYEGNTREREILVKTLRDRAQRGDGDHYAARALSMLPKIFQGLEID